MKGWQLDLRLKEKTLRGSSAPSMESVVPASSPLYFQVNCKELPRA